MSPNRHSISAVSTVKKLNTPLKASVVLLTAIILSSCATDGGDDTVTPKPSPILPTSDAGGTSDSGTSGNGTAGGGVGTTNEAEKAIKAAEAKTKVAEDALKIAEARTKAAEDALKVAEEGFGKQSEKAAAASQEAIDAAKFEAVKAKTAAEAARVEAVAKIEAAAKEAEGKIKAVKEAAAKDAVAKVKAVEEKVKAAEARAIGSAEGFKGIANHLSDDGHLGLGHYKKRNHDIADIGLIHIATQIKRVAPNLHHGRAILLLACCGIGAVVAIASGRNR